MKKLIAFFIGFILYGAISYSQCQQDWMWAHQSNTLKVSTISPYASCTDNAGYIYIAGYTQGTLNIYKNYTLSIPGAGGKSGFLMKLDKNGNLIWAKGYSGNWDDYIFGLTTDKENNVYICGHSTSDVLKFDTFTMYRPKEYPSGKPGKMGFVVKHDSSGKVQWVRTNLSGRGWWQGVAVDEALNVYVTTRDNKGDIYYDSTTKFTDNDYVPTITVKYDKKGNVVWARKLGRNPQTSQFSYDISYSKGLVYVTGIYMDDIYFAGKTYSTKVNEQYFLLCYDTLGNELWANSPKDDNGLHYTAPRKVVTSNNGNAYLYGRFGSTIKKGGVLVIGKDTLPEGENYSLQFLIVKYSGDGNIEWARGSKGKVELDDRMDIAIDEYENTYVTGTFIHDSLIVGDTALWDTVAWNPRLFLAKYNKDGEALWGTHIPDNGVSRAYSLALDEDGNPIVTGHFDSEWVGFGKDTLRGLWSASSTPIFVAKYANRFNVTTTYEDPKCKDDLVPSIKAFPQGGTPPYSFSWDNGKKTNEITNQLPGNFTVTVKDKNNCSIKNSFTIYNPPYLNLQLIVKDETNGSGNGSAEVKVTGGIPPYSYLWDDPQKQTTPKISNLHANNYTVTVSDSNGCVRDTQAIVGNNVSIEESKLFYNLYPNPSNTGIFVLQPLQYTDFSWKIYNSLGELILEQNKSTAAYREYTIDLSNQSEGVYYLKIETNGKHFTNKLMYLK